MLAARLHGISWTSLILMPSALFASSFGPSLNLSDINELKEVTSQAMRNLMSYYQPNSQGVFDQKETPWHESGMIWGMHFDYASWTGDAQFLSTVTKALFNQSNGNSHTFLEPEHPDVDQWNDDILWPSQAAVAAAEFYGPDSQLPSSDETWINLAVKTFEQADAQMDNKCGGGIYWFRDRNDPKGTYKSLITHLEFISQGARNYVINKDIKTLQLAQRVLDWVTFSGLANPHTGVLMDGVDVRNCTKLMANQWSYNYGEFLGSLAWMYRATGDQKYLDMAGPYLDFSRRVFAGPDTNGVLAELCELRGRSCNFDQHGFKAVYVRNLAYLHQNTKNGSIKSDIRSIIHTSIRAMVNRSCDQSWNCGGNWTQDTRPVKNVRSQHVSTALLVAAVGIHVDSQPGKH